MLGNTHLRIELSIIGICCLPVASTVALLTLSRNASRLNLNRKLYSLRKVSCDTRYTAKACAYSCQHRLWRHAGVGEFGEFGEISNQNEHSTILDSGYKCSEEFQ